ncbi:MAG: immune inhibitor A [Anaerolineae bacterium]|nr:immune inhibitor A [Anaerolineae bacterium]
MHKRSLIPAFVFICLLIGLPASAQEATTAPPRDPLALARRFLGFQREFAFGLPALEVEVGDQAQFWVPKRASDTPQQITATLAGRAADVEFWVEEDILYNESEMAALAQAFQGVFTSLRLRSLYGGPQIQLQEGETPLPEDFMPAPDVDGVDRVTVLYARDLAQDAIARYSPVDSIPAALVAGGYSNERELLLVDTTLFPDVPLTNGLYTSSLVRTYYDTIAEFNDPGQAEWLQNVLADIAVANFTNSDPSFGGVIAYLDAPGTPLIQTGNFATRARYDGGHLLFLSYFIQRFGQDAFRALFNQSGSGVAPVDAALAEASVLDPITNAPVSARAAFADFVVANLLNRDLGDGRYQYTAIELPQSVRARVTPLAGYGDTTISNRQVGQFGSYYLLITNDTQEDSSLTLSFDGSAQTARLPMPDREPDDPFYWSGTAEDADPTLTRSIDLRAATAATLAFDAWYALPDGLDYAYASVSTDDGETWTPLPATDTTARNPYGMSYGTGFTGASNSQAPQPFAYLGVVLTGDGVTIGDVVADGPAAVAGVQAGDVIAGYDGQEWQRVPNIIEVLLDYAPGDTIALMIQRGEGDAAEQLDIPVVLAEHPTRTLTPDSLWQHEQIDLSDYAGQEILLRFETVTLPGLEHQGFAIDNLEIPEVNFADGGDQIEAWVAEGWLQTTNRIDQRYLVQAITSPTETEPFAVQTLIGPDDNAAEGEWRFALASGQQFVAIVSAVNDDTDQPAEFSLTVDVDD